MAILNIKEFFTQPNQKEKFQFIFRQQVRDRDTGNYGEGGVIFEVDATTQENYQLQTAITNNEVQSGGTITDHIHIYHKQ